MEECLVPAHRNQHFQRLGATTEMPKMRKVELSVCPEMIFCLDGHFGNKILDSSYCPRINLTPFAEYIWKAEFNISWWFLLIFFCLP
jgi:hypothetical protein